MNRIRTAYCYLFYRGYKLSERAPSRWMSEWKAGLILLFFELWGAIALGIYIQLLFGVRIISKSPYNISTLLILGILVFIKWALFFRNNNWKQIIAVFDSWPKTKKKRGNWFVFIFTPLTITFIFFAFFLLSRK